MDLQEVLRFQIEKITIIYINITNIVEENNF